MKTMSVLLLVAAFALTVSAPVAWGDDGDRVIGTAFTYQGQVTKAGVALNSTADFQFSLWDSLASGSQIGSTLAVNNVSVAGGLFTVTLDFGAAAFPGNPRWLQVAVRSPAGSGTFTTLSPRQGLSPAPYAIYAATASAAGNADTVDGYHAGNSSGQVPVSNGTVCSALSADLLDGQHGAFYQNAGNLNAGTLPSGRLSGTYSSGVTFSSATNSFTGNGAGLTNVDADMVDGYHAAGLAKVTQVGLPGGGGTVYIDIPHYAAFQLVVTECYAAPDSNAVGFIYGITNDNWIAFQGFDGTGLHVRNSVSLYGTSTIFSVDSGNIVVSAPGDGSYRLKIVSAGSDMQAMLIRP
jgi:hypothetical protein